MSDIIKVKIRFLGTKWWKGIPRQRWFDVAGQRFWNHCRFREQMPDASYVRSYEFYEQNKAIFDNAELFIITPLTKEEVEKIPAIHLSLAGLMPGDIVVLKCQYCGTEIKNEDPKKAKQGLGSYETHCKQNPQVIENLRKRELWEKQQKGE